MQAKFKPYCFFILTALGAGVLSAFLIRNDLSLYTHVKKPALSPPAALFPIVWTALYILMGISGARVYLQKAEYAYETMDALFLYTYQLILNFLWPVIFFHMRTFLFAFLWLIVLWSAVLRMLFKFSVLDAAAAYLQIPYFLWVTFAGYLNFMIYLLN